MSRIDGATVGAERRTRSAEATEALGARLAPALRTGDVVVLSGPLGAGKTRFVAGLARGLSAPSRVRSPAFTLVNEYGGPVPIAHLDLYRIDSGEAHGLGLDELAARAVVVAEWGERLPAEWRAEALVIAIAPGDGDTRDFAARAERGRGLELLAAWNALGAEGA